MQSSFILEVILLSGSLGCEVNPKIFEVSIVASYEVVGVNAKREAITLPQKRNIELRSIFWNKARLIFNNLIKE